MRKEENQKSKVLKLADFFSKYPWNWVLFGFFWLGAIPFISLFTSKINLAVVFDSGSKLEIIEPFYFIGLGISVIICLASLAVMIIWAVHLMPREKRPKQAAIFIIILSAVIVAQIAYLFIADSAIFGSVFFNDYYSVSTRAEDYCILFFPQVLTQYDLMYFIKIALAEPLVVTIDFFILLGFYTAMLIYIPLRILKSIKTGKY